MIQWEKMSEEELEGTVNNRMPIYDAQKSYEYARACQELSIRLYHRGINRVTIENISGRGYQCMVAAAKMGHHDAIQDIFNGYYKHFYYDQNANKYMVRFKYESDKIRYFPVSSEWKEFLDENDLRDLVQCLEVAIEYCDIESWQAIKDFEKALRRNKSSLLQYIDMGQESFFECLYDKERNKNISESEFVEALQYYHYNEALEAYDRVMESTNDERVAHGAMENLSKSENETMLKELIHLQSVYTEKNFSKNINEVEEKIRKRKQDIKSDIKLDFLWCLVECIAIIIAYFSIKWKGIHIIMLLASLAITWIALEKSPEFKGIGLLCLIAYFLYAMLFLAGIIKNGFNIIKFFIFSIL